MKILDLPLFKNFVDSRNVKVLRHKDLKVDLWEYYKRGLFENYQNEHGRDIFNSADFIISFIAERYNSARYVGVWKVLDKKKLSNGKYQYKTTKLADYNDLVERLVVKWGGGARSWAQWLHKRGNKEVYEIFPPNYVREFPGFYEFTLTYFELRQLINNPESNREWYRMLSSISAVYVILDFKSGNQYIGSAYGQGGLWGRWKSYSKDPSGGNKEIKKLLAKYPKRFFEFQFSILRVLEHGSTKEAVIDQETLLKKKLGSKVFGMNNN